MIVTYFAFALGPNAAWMASSKWLTVFASAVLVSGLVWVSMLGLRVGKWVTNAGGSRTIVALGVLVVLSLFHPTCGTLLSYHQLPLARPGAVQPQRLHQNDLWSPLWLRIRSYLCRRVPQSGAHPRWSVLFAAPVIALLYIFGTSAILAFVPSGQVNLIGPCHRP